MQVSKQLSSSAAVPKAGPPPIEKPAVLTSAELEKPVCIRLEETETIWLLHLPGGCINADTDEGKAVETANSKWAVFQQQNVLWISNFATSCLSNLKHLKTPAVLWPALCQWMNHLLPMQAHVYGLAAWRLELSCNSVTHVVAHHPVPNLLRRQASKLAYMPSSAPQAMPNISKLLTWHNLPFTMLIWPAVACYTCSKQAALEMGLVL